MSRSPGAVSRYQALAATAGGSCLLASASSISSGFNVRSDALLCTAIPHSSCGAITARSDVGTTLTLCTLSPGAADARGASIDLPLTRSPRLSSPTRTAGRRAALVAQRAQRGSRSHLQAPAFRRATVVYPSGTTALLPQLSSSRHCLPELYRRNGGGCAGRQPRLLRRRHAAGARAACLAPGVTD